MQMDNRITASEDALYCLLCSPQHHRGLSNSWLADNDDLCGTRAKPKGGGRSGGG